MADEPQASVLVVDRDPAIARTAVAFLEERHYQVEWVDDGEKACNRLDNRLFDVLITELTSPRVDGMRLMAVARNRNPEICVIVIAEHVDVELATEAMREGAYDFQTKPLNLGKLEAVIQRGLGHQRLVLERHELKRRLDEQYGLSNLIGKSRLMARVYDEARQIAPTRAAVLLQGESGTGKDLIAQAIHNTSPRRDEAFVKLNCASIPGVLVESELFGHVVGAFPGADHTRVGRFELAHHGTLFLDEISELTLPLQAKLVQVLEHQQLARMGDSKTRAIDVRIITATNHPLESRIESGEFLIGLYDRLRATLIQVPAVRHRRDDIPLLTDHFIREACAAKNRPYAGISRNALDLLMRYDWPGNVRELKNVVEGMVIAMRGERILDVQDVPEHIRRGAAPQSSEIRIPVGVPMTEVERIAIEETLKGCGYNKEACARTLGIGLRTLYRKIKEYDIR